MNIHLEKDNGDLLIVSCETLEDLWSFLEREQTESTGGGLYYYDILPTHNEAEEPILVVNELYQEAEDFGAELVEGD